LRPDFAGENGDEVPRMTRIWIVAAGLGGFVSVALAAAARHGPSETDLAARAELLDIAARYLMYHSLALLAVALLARLGATLALRVAGWSFLAGMIAFAGGLSALAVTGSSLAGASTPVGGTLFMLGWLALAVHGWRRRE
jgi:uncharacterized membrane protein YgdD (TMEM256/DUF423 family)